jgi:DNA-binding MarR family transcriptional regulator
MRDSISRPANPPSMSISIQDLQESPGQLLRRAHQLAMAIAADQLTPHGLTAMQFGAMVILSEKPGIDATRLAALFAFDRATLTGVIDRLEAKGLVLRQPHPSDRRTRLLHLTPEGQKLLRNASRAAKKSRHVVLDPLSPDERETLLALLTKLVAAQSERVPEEVQALVGRREP